MKRFAIALSLLLVAWGVWSFTPATFAIKNESGQAIRSLTVEVAGKTVRYFDIPPGGEVRGSFHFTQEASLHVTGEFADRTRFGESCGYVVWEEFAPHVNVAVWSADRVDEVR
jgi:hypothetical protein